MQLRTIFNLKKYFWIICLIAYSKLGICQLVDPTKIEYTRELSFGINTNTNSSLIGGFQVRHAKE